MTVSFVVVAYNAQNTLPSLLKDLCAQDYPHEKIEVLLIDSMSKDGTRAVMESFAAEDHGFQKVVLLENPGKTLPCGCNVALKNYTGDAIVRLDAHSNIDPDFISKNVEILESGEDISGGQVESILANDTPFQRTLLLAENSAFCGGVAAFRRLTARTYVNTMAFAMYRREVYDKVGLYNENLARTEDNDMSYRIGLAGYKMCCDPVIKTRRVIRSSFKALLRQKYLNGYWIGKTMGIQPKCFSLFHLVPLIFVFGILFTTVLACVGFPMLAAVMWTLYAVAAVGASILDMRRTPFVWTHLLLPFVFLALHVAYGVGTLVGLIALPFWLRKIKK